MTNKTPPNREISIDKTYRLEGSLVDVFNYIANPENDADWQSSCDSVALDEADAPLRAGTGYIIFFSFLSRRMNFRAHVTEYEPYSRYAYESLSGPMHYRGRYELREKDGGVDVTWHFGATPGNFFGIIPRNLIKKTLIKKTDEDVERLKGIFQHRSKQELVS